MANMLMSSLWPPELPEDELVSRHSQIKDWQITHGSLIKLFRTDQGHSVLSRPIGVSMFPTLFPRSRFAHALALQKLYNQLYVHVAEDETWLRETLKELIASDRLAKVLWSIHEEASREACVQPLTLGIFRSDYMLHGQVVASSAPPELKQVEFNTFTVAGGSHSNIVADMHHHLAKLEASGSRNVNISSDLPENHTISSIVSALAMAHKAYAVSRASSGSSSTYELAILFVVQPNNVNICDERPVEFGLWNQDPPIPSFRVEFPDDIDSLTVLDHSRRLLFRPQPLSQPTRTFEVSVIYLRAGHSVEEYSDQGIATRLHLEKSCAIKCPSILSHLTTFKKVQQALAQPGALEHFIPPAEAALIADTFAPLLPLDTSEAGMQARALATKSSTAANYVLKPSLEGGGHNVYGEDIPAFLNRTDKSHWPHYILHELIKPPETLQNILLSHRGIYRGSVVSELGVFGTVLWRRKAAHDRPEILHNGGATGWTFKTKAPEVNEMSVIKGYGCFDCPLLVDDIGQELSDLSRESGVAASTEGE